MTAWSGPPPSRRAMDALERLSLPSIAGPLTGSDRIGLSRWLDPRSPDQVAAAYRSADAPIPQGATIREEGDGVLVVVGPFRTSGIFLSAQPAGCGYTITPGPSLILEGPRPMPHASVFVRTSPAPMDDDPEGRSLICQADLGGKPWVVMVNTQTDGSARASKGVVAQATMADMNDKAWHGTKFEGPAALSRSSRGAIVAEITTAAGPVRVEAFLTDSFGVVMPTPVRKATSSLSTVKGSHPSAPTLTGKGFDPGEGITIDFDGASLSTATANESGEFSKRVTIPHESAPGRHVVGATGKKSTLQAKATFFVLAGR